MFIDEQNNGRIRKRGALPLPCNTLVLSSAAPQRNLATEWGPLHRAPIIQLGDHTAEIDNTALLHMVNRQCQLVQ